MSQKPHINVDYFEDLTGDIEQASSDSIEDIGKRIRDMRDEKGRTIEKVADFTGLDAKVISKIESGELHPTLGNINKLSKVLDSSFGYLISGSGDKPYSITRKDEYKSVKAASSTAAGGKRKTYTRKSLAPEVKERHMEPLIVELENISLQEPQAHDGEESIFVLNGIVCLTIGDEKFELNPGDNAYYPSTIPHIIGAKDERATILAVMYEG